MKIGRRYFISNVAMTLVGVNTLWAAGQGQETPPVQSVPDATNRPNRPQPDDLFPAPTADPRAQLKESQKNLRRDADHLLELANQLKDEAYKTEQTDVLSLPLIHKAEEVEKLAKQIKDRIRST